MIPENLLEEYNARIVNLSKDTIIFNQGKPAYYYFQVLEGEVKMAHYNEDGQEFIQGIFNNGMSFGEPALFGEFTYPCSAVTIKDTSIAKMRSEDFFKLLENNFEIHKKFNNILSKRLRYKGIILNEISSYPAAHRIQTVLKYLRHKYGQEQEPFEVPFTRQQIADMTGLRVETVIKTIKQLSQKDELNIHDHKVVLK
ncbi:Crp/Fnr family transcriptional regulator [Fulvivirga lutimaris]|uniref:Crp/Fnr family transcriptional regulator n=1 Tax=Fulvivirga lutimaris TaxID=1819566 RepID=UPI0012BBBC42|nr:Crp/Fnr family transcriptional regulator [Fulvivirga lutimaris]MTI40447.1 Crp/Fnr family transcriptional regulator [Fulvivirga lutimaris]